MTSVQEDWLLEVQEYLEEHEDVADGSYGEPRPNRAMQLLMEMKRIGLYKET